MRLTDPFWTQSYNFKPQAFTNIKKGDLGFRHEAPPPMPVSQNWYQGSNEFQLNLPKKIVNTWKGEFFAPGNKVRTAAGWPLVNVYSPEMNFKRSDYTQTLTRI